MKIKGSNKDDILRGTNGDDKISGRGGGDLIMGKEGADILKGGAGRDTFVVSVDQFDFIRDFKPGKDTLVLVDDTLNMEDNNVGAYPLPPSDFGTVITVSNGVVEYKGVPVVAVGNIGITYADIWLN